MSLIFGILSIFVGMLCPIIGIVLGIVSVALSNGNEANKAIGTIGIVISIALWLTNFIILL